MGQGGERSPPSLIQSSLGVLPPINNKSLNRTSCVGQFRPKFFLLDLARFVAECKMWSASRATISLMHAVVFRYGLLVLSKD